MKSYESNIAHAVRLQMPCSLYPLIPTAENLWGDSAASGRDFSRAGRSRRRAAEVCGVECGGLHQRQKGDLDRLELSRAQAQFHGGKFLCEGLLRVQGYGGLRLERLKSANEVRTFSTARG